MKRMILIFLMVAIIISMFAGYMGATASLPVDRIEQTCADAGIICPDAYSLNEAHDNIRCAKTCAQFGQPWKFANEVCYCMSPEGTQVKMWEDIGFI